MHSRASSVTTATLDGYKGVIESGAFRLLLSGAQKEPKAHVGFKKHAFWFDSIVVLFCRRAAEMPYDVAGNAGDYDHGYDTGGPNQSYNQVVTGIRREPPS